MSATPAPAAPAGPVADLRRGLRDLHEALPRRSARRPSPFAGNRAAYQHVDLDAFGLTSQRCAEALQFVDRSGQVFAAEDAVARLLLTARPWWRPLGAVLLVPGVHALAGVVYRWVARNRFRLPGGTPACAVPPAPARGLKHAPRLPKMSSGETERPDVEFSDRLAGEPDGFARLWTPHRMAYLLGDNKPVTSEAGQDCPFCRAPTLDDETALIVARGTLTFVVLNLYPYNAGHVMVCPYRHVPLYTDVTDDERDEIARVTQQAMRVLTAVSRCHGFNLGMNQGPAAGAGIAAHLHQHVVPRWGGDANFLPIVGRTKALPELLGDTRRRLAEAWDSHPA